SENVRIDRIVKRDSFTEQQVIERMKFQMPESEKENLADFVLKNESNLEDLESKTKFFLMLFESMTKQ
ncbi:MAG: dephospho-CoA kinase, partial [Chlorobi bacterium]|nr:dephospho-CoA kinase [Chlorobiota bacterium]